MEKHQGKPVRETLRWMLTDLDPPLSDIREGAIYKLINALGDEPVCFEQEQHGLLLSTLLFDNHVECEEQDRVLSQVQHNPFPLAAQIITLARLKCAKCINSSCELRDPEFPLIEEN